MHLIATDGCFYAGGTFTKGPGPEAKDLEELFRYQVLEMLKAEGKLNDAVIENMLCWRHSGFNVYCGPTMWPNNDQGLEDLARYIIRACFSQKRMTYLPAAVSSTAFRKNRARLIQKIYQIDPLLCPKCQGAMKIISFIEDDALIRKILQHIGLWQTRIHDPPQLDDAHIPLILKARMIMQMVCRPHPPLPGRKAIVRRPKASLHQKLLQPTTNRAS